MDADIDNHFRKLKQWKELSDKEINRYCSMFPSQLNSGKFNLIKEKRDYLLDTNVIIGYDENRLKQKYQREHKSPPLNLYCKEIKRLFNDFNDYCSSNSNIRLLVPRRTILELLRGGF